MYTSCLRWLFLVSQSGESMVVVLGLMVFTRGLLDGRLIGKVLTRVLTVD